MLALGWAAGLAVLVCLPFFVSNYHLFQSTMVIVTAVGVLGLNMLLGYNGQLSLGHGAFYALGAYTTAILIDHYDLEYWLTLPAAAGICLIFGFLFGLPALRLRGHHLALATFALALATPQVLKYKGLDEWTGGVQGIVLMKPSAPFHLPINDDQWLYYYVLAVAAVLFVLAWNLLRGHLGRAMVAIKEQPIAAEAMGINVALSKSMTFGISALYMGVAGSLGAVAVQYVSPDSFPVFLSISFLVGVVFGGVGTISGAIFGALFIQFVPTFADQISKAAPWAIYGLVLIASMYVLPRGCVGLIVLVRNRWGASR